ncbi:gamma-glutamylcyclotransferase family protein [Rhodanobacter koreensis]
MLKQYYLAYGSNLHPYRLEARTPSAKAVALIKLAGQRLTFHKQSKDGSGKCNLIEDKVSVAYGVLYEIDSSEMPALHASEGPGYIQQQVKVVLDGQVRMAIVYIAAPGSIGHDLLPYDWYRDLVVLGADFYSFPVDYLAELRGISSLIDPDNHRAQSNQGLISRMQQHPALIRAICWVPHPADVP